MTGNKQYPLVYAIVLVYNNCDDTVVCIESLLESNYPNLTIIIVDNGSPDNCAARLRNKFPKLLIIENICNLGFAVGNNVGLQYAHEHNADYILLVNNDTIAAPETITNLIKTAELDEKIAAVAPKILEFQNPEIISFAGGLIHLWKGSTQHIGQGEVDNGQYDQRRDCDYLTGAFLLVKRYVIEKIGLIPDVYFMYWEDVDWCMSMRKAGFRLCYEPNALITHKVSTSTKKLPYFSISMEYKGARIFIKRWIKGLRKPTAHFFRFIYFLRRIVYMVRST